MGDLDVQHRERVVGAGTVAWDVAGVFISED